MAESIGPISSAVDLPTKTEAPISPRSKRRQSSDSDDPTSKRPRISSNGAPDSAEAAPSNASSELIKPEPLVKEEPSEQERVPVQDRRRSSVQEERKRGQRLFGGLLSTLSRSTTDGQQKRRQEIEKRQVEKRQEIEKREAEKAQQLKHEADLRRAEKLVQLKDVRKAEQIKFDEQSMRIRHSNMLAMANFLHTKTEPKLYYKPWELLPKDRNRIQEQKSEAKAIIESEVDEFYKKYSKTEANTNSAPKETMGEPYSKSSPVSSALIDATNPPAQDQVMAENQALEEPNGEVVFGAEEDTVIY